MSWGRSKSLFFELVCFAIGFSYSFLVQLCLTWFSCSIVQNIHIKCIVGATHSTKVLFMSKKKHFQWMRKFRCMSFKSDKLTVSSILVMNPYLRRVLHDTVSCEPLSARKDLTCNSNEFKLRHSTICTLYSSQWMKTKCTRCNMRSTCQWSCVLQFTWRRAVCCGLHRPMSLVIPCLRLVFDIFHIEYYTDINLILIIHVRHEKYSHLGESL